MVTVSNQSRCIKKYKNRRLYDLEISQHVTIDDLKQYVIDGIVFQVIDSETHQDITNMILLQIFVELESNNLPFLSSDMLRQLIIISQHPMQKSFKLFLEHMMSQMYLK